MSSVFDSLVAKIEAGLGKFEFALDKVESFQEAFFKTLKQLVDVTIQIIKILTKILSAVADNGQIFVLLIPATAILFVVSKITQIL